jgi:hypothetical protein
VDGQLITPRFSTPGTTVVSTERIEYHRGGGHTDDKFTRDGIFFPRRVTLLQETFVFCIHLTGNY